MLTTYYSLARESAVLFERCYVNKWYYNDLLVIGHKACVNYLKNAIDICYGSNYNSISHNAAKAMKSTDLCELTYVITYNFGLSISQDIVSLINSMNKYSNITEVGIEEYKGTKDDMSDMQKAIDACKRISSQCASTSNSSSTVASLLAKAEGTTY